MARSDSSNALRYVLWVAAMCAVLPPTAAGEPPRGGEPPILSASKQLPLERSGSTHEQLVKMNGGNAESEATVARGLAWLSRQQKKDGTWPSDGADKESVASTALCVLPFLAAGQTHKGTGKENKYKDNVAAALKALVKMQKADGSFSENTTANAIAVIALCEAFSMTSDKALLLKPCQAAVDFIQKGQGANGSWGEKYGDEGGASVVGWHAQALHSAKMCKELKVDPKVLDKTTKFLDTVATKPKGSDVACLFGDRDATPKPTFTAVGLLSRCNLSGWGSKNVGLRDGVDYLLKAHPPGEKQPFDACYYYHATRVAMARGDDPWAKEWNPKMRDLLITKQVNVKDMPSVDGSWEKDKFWSGDNYGRLGTTALAILTLEVYYGYLPLYNRGTGGKDLLDGK